MGVHMVSRCVSLLVIICCMLCICLGLTSAATSFDGKESLKPFPATKKEPAGPASPSREFSGFKGSTSATPTTKEGSSRKQFPEVADSPHKSPKKGNQDTNKAAPAPPPTAETLVPGLSCFDFLQVPADS